MKSIIRNEFAKTLALFSAMAADSQYEEQLCATTELCLAALQAKKKILIAGNGGSAADAQHWAGELVSRFNFDRPGLAAIALSTDTSIITACGNDYGYDYIFARQVEALGQDGDVLFALSTSGNSKNILRAVHAARDQGLRVIGFTGASGGALAPLCDVCFCVPSQDTPKVQEAHEFLGHVLCGLIELRLFAHLRPGA